MVQKRSKLGIILLGILLCLFVLWVRLPNAADASQLTEFSVQGIEAITLYPRYGSGDPEIQITSPKSIGEIIGWFSSVKVLSAAMPGCGTELLLVFHSEDGSRMSIGLSNMSWLYISSAQSGTMVGLWNNYDSFWSKYLTRS